MGVKAFDDWVGPHHREKLNYLSGDTIAFDAAHFLQQYRYPQGGESLVAAMGGFPLGQEAVIMKDIKSIQQAGIQPLFVFNGLSFGDQEDPFGASVRSRSIITRAFAVFDQPNMAEDALAIWKTAGIPDAANFEAFFKKILHENKIEYCVAPYAAHGQMKYMFDRNTSESEVQALYGSTELLAYDLPMLITKINLAYEEKAVVNGQGVSKTEIVFSFDKSTFEYLLRQDILDSLQPGFTEEDLTECLILSGTPLLEAFPPLRDPTLFPQWNFATVVDLYMRAGKNVERLCISNGGNARIREIDYYDKYARAWTAVRHMIALKKSNEVEPLNKIVHEEVENNQNKDNLDDGRLDVPDDLHDCIGLRLPEELHSYIFSGIISPKFPDWLGRGKILIQLPLEGADNAEYRSLIKGYLGPWRKQCLALLANNINRALGQARNVSTVYWFDTPVETVTMKENVAPHKDLYSWRVTKEVISEREKAVTENMKSASAGTLYYAFSSLVDGGFATKTIGTRPQIYKPLTTVDELVCNLIWRFMFLRGYVGEDHQLTAWGKLLASILANLDSTPAQAEAAFVAVELIRAGLLKQDVIFPGYSGAAVHGTETDQKNCRLVSRLACTAEMDHPKCGWSGPLSRELLAYHSMVSAIRIHLRDLLEMALIHLLQSGDGDRDANKLLEVKHKLPFLEEPSNGLAILTKTCLDEINNSPANITDKDAIKAFHNGTRSWFAYLDLEKNVKTSYALWDAVYGGLKTAPEALFSNKDKVAWKVVDEWFEQRRI